MKYWIVAAREEIQDRDKECNNECRRRKLKTAEQSIMVPLPDIRLRNPLGIHLESTWSIHARFCRKVTTKTLAMSVYVPIKSGRTLGNGLWSGHRQLFEVVRPNDQSRSIPVTNRE